ncbi:MAG: hypothetical protein MUF64_11115 [Polyangiaceae bacterium]|jgi:hypothetical protein|nr:hypothetical protein [Polyangiaceae bacterium]
MPKRTPISEPPPFDEGRVRDAIRECEELQKWLSTHAVGLYNILPKKQGASKGFHVEFMMLQVDKIERMGDVMRGLDGEGAVARRVHQAIMSLEGKLMVEDPQRAEARWLEDVVSRAAHDPRGLGKITSWAWRRAYRAWQGVRSQRGGDPATRYSAAAVLYELLHPHVTQARSLASFSTWLTSRLRTWSGDKAPSPNQLRGWVGKNSRSKGLRKKSS